MSETIAETPSQSISFGPSIIHFLNCTVKRACDICGSFLGLVFLSPVFLVIAIMLKRESPGPVFYRGPRIGQGGKAFGILKFRTMH